MSLHVVAFPARANPTDLSIFRKNVPFEKRREVGGRANAPRSKNWSIDERRGGEIQLYSVIVLPDHSMGVSPISYALSSNELRNIKETCADT